MNVIERLLQIKINIIYKRITPPRADLTYYCDAEKFFLKIQDVAAYEVCAKSNTIYVELDHALSDPNLVKNWLYGSVLAFLLHHHGFLVLHGSAIVANQQAVIFCGNSGIGKSTLAAALNQKGYPFLTDDLAVVHFFEDSIKLIPISSTVKLWSDALTKLEKSTLGLHPVSNKLGKYEAPVNHVWPSAVKIKRIYELSVTNQGTCVTGALVSDFEQIKLLIRNTYRYHMLRPLRKLDKHLQQITQLAAITPCYQLVRPAQSNSLNEIVDYIENQLNEDKNAAKYTA